MLTTNVPLMFVPPYHYHSNTPLITTLEHTSHRRAVSRAYAAEQRMVSQREYTSVAQMEQAKAEALLAKATRYITVLRTNHPPDALTQALARSKERVRTHDT